MSWPDRKLSDNPELVREHMVDPDREVRPTSTVRAPCCDQRRCAGDMVCWVPGEGWRCDACRARLRRDPDTEWTKPKLMRAMGAPASEVRGEEVKRRARRRIREMKRRDETINWREVFGAVDREVRPASEGHPPGTAPPVEG